MLIDSFFFLKYHHQYATAPYDGIEAKEPKFKKGDEVWFIRLRVLAEQEHLSALDDSLIKYVDKSTTSREKEKCTYDEKADFGGRFGEPRRELVRKYLEYASRITLSLLDEPKDKKYYNNIGGLIHLPSNMLDCVIKCPKCQYPIQL